MNTWGRSVCQVIQSGDWAATEVGVMKEKKGMGKIDLYALLCIF